MGIVQSQPARRSGSLRWGLLRRCWPVGVVLAAALGVLASPALQALLVALIWTSWLLVAYCAVTARGRARALGLRLLGRSHRAAVVVLRPLLVQARRLRSRVRGELPAGERS